MKTLPLSFDAIGDRVAGERAGCRSGLAFPAAKLERQPAEKAGFFL